MAQINFRKLAQGKPCQVRLPGCNHDPATTILAHYPLSGYTGTGMKPDDFAFGAWCCSACHDLVDGRINSDHDKKTLRLAHAEGCLRTQAELRDMKKRGELL
ncbi:MAG: DUF1364 domain-containing protein [Ketobacter sp.]|nr:DUF1364 domain-containing protein [Ketobacter sp.]